ncbi:MAG: DUF1214 domain-containing protein [Pseudomonadota bacterium]
MIWRAIAYCFAGFAGLAVGVASALYLSGLWSSKQPMEYGNVRVDGWASDFAVGTQQASPYVRARVARHGLLALANTEAVYFVRGTDADGQRLTERCDYRLSGGALPAQWWSITLYRTQDSMLPMNEDNALSIDATGITAEGELWDARIAASRPADTPNWISSRKAGEFDLLLRLYVPDAALLDDPQAALSPPTIERLSCAGDEA